MYCLNGDGQAEAGRLSAMILKTGFRMRLLMLSGDMNGFRRGKIGRYKSRRPIRQDCRAIVLLHYN